MIASRFGLRALGFINTIVLARLLTPEDFGLVSLCMLSVGFITLFADIGMYQAILRRTEVSSGLINTAWTLGVVIGLCLSILIFIAAPFAAAYFKDPRIIPVMQLIALQPFLDACNNIGFVLYSKDLQFNKVFIRTLLSKSLGIAASIAIAFWLRNYWALALGMILQSLITALLSYVLHPYRPRFCLSDLAELRSDWVNFAAKNIATFLKMKADEFIVGSIGGAASLGGYYVSKSVATMLTVELIQPVGGALLPGYSKMLNEPERLKAAFNKVMQTVAIFAFAFGCGMFAIASDFVALVFGNKWTHIVPLLQVFSIGGLIGALQSIVSPVLIAKGKLKAISVFMWFNLVCFLAVLWPVARHHNPYLIAKTLIVFDFFMFLICLGMVKRYLQLSLFDFIKAFTRPVLSASLMLYSIHFLHMYVKFKLPIVDLVCIVLTGALVFIFSMLITWILCGRPEGPEKMIMHKCLKAS